MEGKSILQLSAVSAPQSLSSLLAAPTLSEHGGSPGVVTDNAEDSIFLNF